MPYLSSSPASKMPRPTQRSSMNPGSRAQPYSIPSSATMVPTSSTQRHAPSNNGDRHSSVPWTAADDTQLIQARQQNMNWGPIAKKYFPNKTPNACRKRHERLMEKRNLNGAWNAAKFDQLAKAYAEVREPMWKLLAEKVNEKWQTVEIKVGHLTDTAGV